MVLPSGIITTFSFINHHVLIYLLRTALQQKEIIITSQDSTAMSLTLAVPACYQLLPSGVRKVTPSLFQQAASSLTPQWDLMKSVNDLQLQGLVNSAVDILTRRIIQSIVYYDVRMHVTICDLIGSLLIVKSSLLSSYKLTHWLIG